MPNYTVITGTSLIYEDEYGPQQTESITEEELLERRETPEIDRIFVRPKSATTVNEVEFNLQHQRISSGFEAELISEKTFHQRLTEKLAKEGHAIQPQNTTQPKKGRSGQKRDEAGKLPKYPMFKSFSNNKSQSADKSSKPQAPIEKKADSHKRRKVSRQESYSPDSDGHTSKPKGPR